MSVLTEERERFLSAIASHVAPERIAEVHFFQPIRQGGVESGVAVVVESGPEVPDAAPPSRYVVHTARYRLTLKGAERGKWEATLFAEADAPLATVEAVVRGVQRRAGDVDAATMMTGDEVRAGLAALSALRSGPTGARG
jgi:hypothetical protein